jgi:KUP system potassium uptake protein
LSKGGTFALYSLLRQHVNFKGNIPVPLTRLESDVHLKFHSKRRSRPSRLQLFLENSPTAQLAITIIVLIGTCMLIGDGALTPAISGKQVSNQPVIFSSEQLHTFR